MIRNRKAMLVNSLIFGIVCLVMCFFPLRKLVEKQQLLYIPFDGEEENLHYQFEKPLFMEAKTPQWRHSGVIGKSLLFDGSATYLEYSPNDILIEGNCFSVSVWVAPRAFEWDDPNAVKNGNAHITAILSQYNKEKNQGVLLGYQRFGRLCFQIGTGDDWHVLWADEERLSKYQWNHVVAVFDGKNGEISLYLNGNKISKKEINQNSIICGAEEESLLIGKNSYGEKIGAGNYNMFCGLMDELKLYKKALSFADIEFTEPPIIPYDDIALENALTDDIYKTQYHGGPYQHWMNEPHAPLFFNGKYHLFFQSNSIGTYWRNICWGHLVSDDMVSWKPIKNAIEPVENSVVPDGVWSGGATYDKNGIPVLFFTAGNDSFYEDNLISNQNIGVAYPSDINDINLTDWIIYDSLAIEQKEGEGRTGEFRDPHVWQEDGKWNMLICSGSTNGNGGTALLYQSEKLEILDNGKIDMDWKYKGPIFEMENQSLIYGTTWELPVLLPIQNQSKTIRKHMFIFSPAPASIADNKIYYFVGDFDSTKGKFIPDASFENIPRVLDYGNNVFTGPSGFINPMDEEVYLFSIMQDQRNGAEQGAAGWAHSVGLTRNLYLNEDGTDLCVTPIENLEKLRGECLVNLEDVNIETVNKYLSSIKEDMFYIYIRINASTSERFNISFKSDEKKDKTVFEYDLENKTISGETKNKGKAATLNRVFGELIPKDDFQEIEIFVDRSLIEAFFNQEKSISLRAYSKDPSKKIEIDIENQIEEKVIQDFCMYRMNSIYK